MIRIFGYGSLLDERSLRSTAPSAKNIIPAKLFGFVRVFNLNAKTRICSQNNLPIAALNIEKSEINQFVNGIAFEVSKRDFDNLIKRECGYELVQVEVCDYFDSKNVMKVYFFRTLHYEAYPYQFDSLTQQKYLNLCLRGAKIFGEEFYNDFLKTTFIGESSIYDLDEITKSKLLSEENIKLGEEDYI